MRRGILYERLSLSDDASTGIARQDADLRARAAREGIDPTFVLVDDGISGRKTRENAEHALRLLRSGEADALLVWRFDRWSRQGLGALARLIEVLDERPGALFIADRDGLTSDQPAWRIIASVLAEVARMESENTQMRVRSSISALRRARRFAGGAVPYGYEPVPNPDGPGRVLQVVEHEAEVIRSAARRIIAGTSAWRVCRDLNDAREPAPRSPARRVARGNRRAADPVEPDPGTWQTTALRKMLTSPHLLGRVTHRGDVLRDDYGLPLTVWEPILTPEEHARLRTLLEIVPAPEKGRKGRSRALSGLIVCGDCGERLYVTTSGGHPTYACNANSATGAPRPRVRARLVEEIVFREARAHLFDFPVSTTEIVSGDPAALVDVEEALQRTTAELLEDDSDPQALLARLALLKARRAELRNTALPQALRVLRDGPRWIEAFDAAEDDDRRRELLAAGIERIRLLPAATRGGHVFDESRVAIDWRPDLAESV